MNTKNVIQSEMKVNNVEILVLKKNIKNLHLNVLPPDGKVRVSVPLSTSDDTVHLFVLSRMLWIKKQKKNFLDQLRQSERRYISGESYYFKGSQHLLSVQVFQGKAYVEVRNKKYIDFFVSKDLEVEKKNKIFTKWYRDEMKKELPKLVEKWQKVVGVEANNFRIRKMKTKWGTCNTEKKVIWLNLDLIKKPIHCLEYIIVHELVHLKEEKHNNKFISYMYKYMPKWRQYKRELNEIIL